MTDWTALRRTIEAASDGEWTAREYVVDAPGGEVAMVHRRADGEAIASAITAMPEMLALLEEARETLLRLDGTYSDCSCDNGPCGWVPVRALIARLPETTR